MGKSDQIRAWVEHGKKIGAAYVVSRTDTFPYPMEDFPVHAMAGEDVHKIVDDTSNMEEIMEVYDMSMDIEMQLAERPTWNI